MLLADVQPNDMEPKIPLLIGDVVHNLRTSLDYMINDICHQATGRKSKRLGFPFHEKREQLLDLIKNLKRDEGLPDDIAELIVEEIRPWASPDKTEVGIWGLNKLDNADKHRLLVTTVTATRLIDLDIDVQTPSGIITMRGADIGLSPMPGLTGRSSAETRIVKAYCGVVTVVKVGNVSCGFLFGAGPYEGFPVAETLTRLAELTLGIFDAFCLRRYGEVSGLTMDITFPQKDLQPQDGKPVSQD